MGEHPACYGAIIQHQVLQAGDTVCVAGHVYPSDLRNQHVGTTRLPLEFIGFNSFYWMGTSKSQERLVQPEGHKCFTQPWNEHRAIVLGQFPLIHTAKHTLGVPQYDAIFTRVCVHSQA